MSDNTEPPGYTSEAAAIRQMIEWFQASVEDNASRHAWLPPDAIKEHYHPSTNNVRRFDQPTLPQ